MGEAPYILPICEEAEGLQIIQLLQTYTTLSVKCLLSQLFISMKWYFISLRSL